LEVVMFGKFLAKTLATTHANNMAVGFPVLGL